MDPHGTGSNTRVPAHEKYLVSDFLFLLQVGDVFSSACRVINETKSSNYVLPKREIHTFLNSLFFFSEVNEV